jgi:hypothetical protein
MPTFKEYIEARCKQLKAAAVNDKDRRLAMIETEAMGIAHRELENAFLVASSFFPADKLTMSDVMHLQDMLAGLYPLALHELIERGEIERPREMPPAATPASVLKGGN